MVRCFDARLGQRSDCMIAHRESRAPAQNPLRLPLAQLKQDLVVNFDSAYVAAQQAVKFSEKVSQGLPKVFIYTGNVLNQHVLPGLFSLGVGKAAAAHLIESAAAAYNEKGFR
jgi:hypothetical protein